MKQVLITGGAGAIGSRLANRLLQEDVEKVVIVDDLSSGYEFLIPKDERVEFIRADINQIDRLDFSLKKPTVFHLAAFFANQNSVDHPKQDLQVNGQGMLSVLEWSKKHHAAKFVYASAGCSICEHGQDEMIHEEMPVSLKLDTPYQITKALGEFYCNYYNQFFPTVRCRFFNSYGPGEIPGYYRNVIPNFIWWSLQGKPLPITGTGEETRDFIFVEDLVEGLVLSSKTEEAGGEAFNLGSGIETKIFELAEVIQNMTGSTAEIEFKPRRSWDNSISRCADISKAKKILDFNPLTSLYVGLEKTYEWFLENRSEIEALNLFSEKIHAGS